jgi:hypothetical protein
LVQEKHIHETTDVKSETDGEQRSFPHPLDDEESIMACCIQIISSINQDFKDRISSKEEIVLPFGTDLEDRKYDKLYLLEHPVIRSR